jgi:N6-adenosine-specific RNA methylase IME4
VKIDNEFQSLLVPLTADEYQQLEQSILAEGCRDSLVLWDELIVDGHNRYAICTQHNLPYNTVQRDFADRDAAKVWILNNQLGRRNISAFDRVVVVSKIKAIEDAKLTARENLSVGGGDHRSQDYRSGLLTSAKAIEPVNTRKKIAELAGVGQDTVHKVLYVNENAPTEIVDKVVAHEMSINAAYEFTKKLDEFEQEPDLVENIISGDLSVPQAKRELVRRHTQSTPDLPTNKYRIIYADPPWAYGDSGVIGETDNYGRANRHYSSMSIQQLCGLSVKELATDNAVLFMWVTSPLLAECWAVIQAWGFEYKTSFVWDKIRHNYGHYNSVRHEFLLICTKGSCLPDNSKLYDSVQSIEKTGKHSEKPDEFRTIIDDLYPVGKRIELFAREQIEGWDVWGNEL